MFVPREGANVEKNDFPPSFSAKTINDNMLKILKGIFRRKCMIGCAPHKNQELVQNFKLVWNQVIYGKCLTSKLSSYHLYSSVRPSVGPQFLESFCPLYFGAS